VVQACTYPPCDRFMEIGCVHTYCRQRRTVSPRCHGGKARGSGARRPRVHGPSMYMYVAAGARRSSHSLARQRLRRAKERKPCCRRRRGTWSARLSSSVIQRGLTSSSKVRIRSMSANTCHPTEKMLRRLADLSSETPSLKLLDTTNFFFSKFG